MDLVKRNPRGPREKLMGMVWLPRVIDKARARLEGTLGEFSYGCPMDQHFFEFVGTTTEAFLDGVRGSPDDAAVTAWLKRTCSRFREAPEGLPSGTVVPTPPDAPASAAIAEFNRMLCELGPSSPESKARMAADARKIRPGCGEVCTWVGMIEVEEGVAN